MAQYWAQIVKGKVFKVIVASTDEIKNYSGKWIETKIDGSEKYAAIGDTWDGTEFKPKKPFPSWTYDRVKFKWVPFRPVPADASTDKPYDWNENTKKWVLRDGQ